MSKHTPGPWECVVGRHGVCVNAWSGMKVNAVIHRMEAAEVLDEKSAIIGWRVSEETKANAQLIAAAPELLE
jgi:hypothetical protein